MIRKIMSLFAAGLLANTATAQTIYQVDMAETLPEIERDDIGYQACGIRVTVADTDRGEGYNFSLRIARQYQQGVAIVYKIGAVGGKFKTGNEPTKIVTPTPNTFWIAKETQGKALRPTSYSELRPGVMAAALPQGQTIDTIMDVVKGETMQFAVGYPSKEKKGENIISFRAPLQTKNLPAFGACFNQLLKGFEDELVEKRRRLDEKQR